MAATIFAYSSSSVLANPSVEPNGLESTDDSNAFAGGAVVVGGVALAFRAFTADTFLSSHGSMWDRYLGSDAAWDGRWWWKISAEEDD